MKTWLTLSAITWAFVATLAWAAVNLSSSKSNFYRLTYPADLVTSEQAKSLLAELDKLGRIDDVRLKQWVPANLKRFGIAGERVAKLVILPPDKGRKEVGIILLTNPEDEAAALAVTKGLRPAGAQ